ncbi:unnamed protein product [Miscanthus lutarioriparius]|uniref:Peptidase A1 domain-containing protein n=1 Tax=Miscanthus lutarioriparius TaxID=422564 RepID=A0A811SGF9_9POAL|nr:unnamed protein product [Miscanthus lutarioriparius]
MRPPEVAVVAVAALLLVAAAAAAAAESAAPLPAALRLERAVPHKGVALEELRRRDAARHRVLRRRLLGAVAGVVDFPVEGSANPYMVGLYFTRVKLGNPAKEFFVQIDTGSDILWVTCSPCTGCPTSSGLNIQLESFSPDSSSTSSRITCSDDRCTAALQTGEAICQTSDSPSSPCGYTFTYGDGSGTSGYYVSDTMFFETVMGNEQTANSSASIVFGCSNSQSGDLTKADRAVDGIFGFGQHQLSVVSQLNSLGVSPKVFSHCLKGSDNGGGILVLGEIVEPGLVYSPLVPSQPHYNLNLESIAVNGQKLSIDSSLFTTSNTQGTIVDSGTTLAYLADGAYDPFVSAIAAAVSPSDNNVLWCIGWQRNQGQEITILGDLVLKDKIFVYDLANMRMGWADYDCSMSVNVTTSSGKNQYVNTGQFDVNGSARRASYESLIPAGIVTMLVHMLIFSSSSRR